MSRLALIFPTAGRFTPSSLRRTGPCDSSVTGCCGSACRWRSPSATRWCDGCAQPGGVRRVPGASGSAGRRHPGDSPGALAASAGVPAGACARGRWVVCRRVAGRADPRGVAVRLPAPARTRDSAAEYQWPLAAGHRLKGGLHLADVDLQLVRMVPGAQVGQAVQAGLVGLLGCHKARLGAVPAPSRRPQVQNDHPPTCAVPTTSQPATVGGRSRQRSRRAR